jgi:hypothetical protein
MKGSYPQFVVSDGFHLVTAILT